jgi:ABC-2 type transport system permease protein
MDESHAQLQRDRHYRLLTAWIPATFRPKVVGVKNRYFSRQAFSLANLLAIFLTALLMIGLYYGAANTLREIQRNSTYSNVTNTLLYGFSIGLFALIFFSSAVTSLGALFMGRDIDLLLASPLAHVSLLRGKAFEVFLSTTWMILVFSIPPYIAFGQHLGAGLSFYAVGPIFVCLYLLLAALSGMIGAIVCASALPARTGRNIFVALFVFVVGALVAAVNGSSNLTVYGRFIQASNHPFASTIIDHPALPSSWLCSALLGLTSEPLALQLVPLVLLAGAITLAWYLLRATFYTLYPRGYDRLHTKPQAYFLFSRSGKARRRFLSIRASQTMRSLATRELFSFGRDITHSIQLALFLTFCVLYFFNFQNISPPVHVGTWTLRAWDLIAVVSFIALSSLIMLSICSRFVFPSVSLEGSSVWILQVAPITPSAILRAKYLTWFIPTALICVVLFASAGLALALEPICVLALAAAACIVSHGLVALGVGLGARFCRFDWEHPAELSATWGSMLFLLVGLVTLALGFVPLCGTFACYIFFPDLFETGSAQLTLFSAGLGALLLINLIIGKIALKIGASALSRVFAG